jgi:hypothetical protein
LFDLPGLIGFGLQCARRTARIFHLAKAAEVAVLDGFRTEGSRSLYHPAGSVSFDEAVERVRAAIALARDNLSQDLLVNGIKLSGFPSPDTFQRFLAAIEWAEEAHGRLRLVMVARPEIIDPQKFGMVVAGNHGLVSNIFTTESEAVAWLDAKRNAAK